MKTVSILLVMFLLTLGQNLNAQNFDFRNTKWGMDSSQVKLAETARYAYSKGNSLFFDGKLGNMEQGSYTSLRWMDTCIRHIMCCL